MKNLFLLLLIPIAFIGCNYDETDLNDIQKENIEEFTLRALYKGKYYEVPCILIDKLDSIIFLNEDFKTVYYNEICKMKHPVCRVHTNDTIEYLDEQINTDSLIAKEEHAKSAIKKAVDFSRASTPIYAYPKAKLHIWDDTNYHDRNYEIQIYATSTSWECPNLINFHDFDNRISALTIRNKNVFNRVCFWGYSGFNYTGDVLEYTVLEFGPYAISSSVQMVELKVPKLKKIPKPSGGNWNDKISSIKFYGYENLRGLEPVPYGKEIDD